MLVEFSITNFRSIKSTQILSMLPAAKIKERPYALLRTENYDKLHLLSSVVLYGANSSGKSNLLKSFQSLQWLVENSASLNAVDKIKVNEYFLFEQEMITKPSSFTIDFIADDGLRYEYSVTFNQDAILFESLYYYTTDKKK